jgi:hypothetical protein
MKINLVSCLILFSILFSSCDKNELELIKANKKDTTNSFLEPDHNHRRFNSDLTFDKFIDSIELNNALRYSLGVDQVYV